MFLRCWENEVESGVQSYESGVRTQNYELLTQNYNGLLLP
jgi:hypothetical protein